MSVTPKTYKNILKYGLQSAYDAIQSKDNDVLYFCTDTRKIFKGAVDYTDSVVFAANKDAVTAPIAGKVYVFANTGTVEVWNDELATPAWSVVSYPLVTSIVDDPSGNDDVHVPSAKAVYDFVEHEIGEVIGGSDVVKSIAQKTTQEGAETVPVRGTFTYTTGDDLTHDVQLTGVVTKPSYEPNSRTFTFPVAGESDVVVELGKDIFIDPEGDNRYEDGFIYLYLNDGTQSEDPTELVIPVTGLIVDYLGGETDSVVLTVDANTHVVTADVVLRPDVETPGSEWENALKLSTTAGAKGLYVDLTDTQEGIDQNEADIAALATATTSWGTF